MSYFPQATSAFLAALAVTLVLPPTSRGQGRRPVVISGGRSGRPVVISGGRSGRPVVISGDRSGRRPKVRIDGYSGGALPRYGSDPRGSGGVVVASRELPSSGFNTTRFPEERARLLTPANRRAFPNLGSRFEVLAPSTFIRGKLGPLRELPAITVLGPAGGWRVYNCIAHSLGIHWGWVNPVTGPAAAPLTRMDEMYASRGYVRLKHLDYRLIPGYQKVVVYATLTPEGRINQVTHAALQSADGTWTSKLGQLALIRHRTLNALRGPSYGQPVAVYIRRRG